MIMENPGQFSQLQHEIALTRKGGKKIENTFMSKRY